MRVRLGVVAAAVLAACVLSVEPAGANRVPAAALPVLAASLTQNGQQLVWKVKLGQPFSPASLKRSHRSLCLLISRARRAGVVASVCVSQGRRHPELVYLQAGGQGAVRVIAGRISRSGPSSLVTSFLPGAVGLAYRSIRWQVQSASSAQGCTPSACTTVFPARPALTKLHTPHLVGCVRRGPSLVYGGSTKVRDVALTFDDGPWNAPPPSAFLHVLERMHAVATFFEIGRQISSYDPRGVYERRMLADGDMIGDHTWSHPDMTRLPLSEQRYQLLRTLTAIKRATHGFTPCLWRPPYGDISRELVSVARSLGLLTVMWDVDPRDWSLPGANAIYGNVVSNAHNGAIVIQHFGGGPRYETLAALPREIATLRRRGYRFVTVAQMLGLRLIYK